MPWMPYCSGMPGSRAFRPEAGGVQVGEPAAHLVDGVGDEDVRVSRDHLVRPGGLEALVERAAVRYAAEDAGDKDRDRRKS